MEIAVGIMLHESVRKRQRTATNLFVGTHRLDSMYNTPTEPLQLLGNPAIALTHFKLQ